MHLISAVLDTYRTRFLQREYGLSNAVYVWSLVLRFPPHRRNLFIINTHALPRTAQAGCRTRRLYYEEAINETFL